MGQEDGYAENDDLTRRKDGEVSLASRLSRPLPESGDYTEDIQVVPEGVLLAFQRFDTNNNNVLDYRELRNALRFLGVDITHPQAAEFIRRYDDTPGGRMEVDEFATLVFDLNCGMVRQTNGPSALRNESQSQLNKELDELNA